MNEEGKGLPLPMNSAEQIGKCSQIQARFRAQVGFIVPPRCGFILGWGYPMGSLRSHVAITCEANYRYRG